MDLKQLYSLRREFTVIGLTTRTGSGCTIISDTLENKIDFLQEGIRNINELEDGIAGKQYN